ncbi:MAG: hypothetical protein AAGI53_08920 [Planctomycetota bacterium]
MRYARVLVGALVILLLAACAARPALRTAAFDDDRLSTTFCDWISGTNVEFQSETRRLSEARGELVLRTVEGSFGWGITIIDRIVTESESGITLAAIQYEDIEDPIELYRVSDEEYIGGIRAIADATRDAAAIWPRLEIWGGPVSGSAIVFFEPEFCAGVTLSHVGEHYDEYNMMTPLELALVIPGDELEDAAMEWATSANSFRGVRSFDPIGTIIMHLRIVEMFAGLSAATRDPEHPMWRTLLFHAEDHDSPMNGSRTARVKELIEAASGR